MAPEPAYWGRQEDASRGRHALTMLVGGPSFAREDLDSVATSLGDAANKGSGRWRKGLGSDGRWHMASAKSGKWEADVGLRALTSKYSYDIDRNFRRVPPKLGGRYLGTSVYGSQNEGKNADGVYAATRHYTCLERTPSGIYHLDSARPVSRERPITRSYRAKLYSPSANPNIARYFFDAFGRMAALSEAPNDEPAGHKGAHDRTDGGEVARERQRAATATTSDAEHGPVKRLKLNDRNVAAQYCSKGKHSDGTPPTHNGVLSHVASESSRLQGAATSVLEKFWPAAQKAASGGAGQQGRATGDKSAASETSQDKGATQEGVARPDGNMGTGDGYQERPRLDEMRGYLSGQVGRGSLEDNPMKDGVRWRMDACTRL